MREGVSARALARVCACVRARDEALCMRVMKSQKLKKDSKIKLSPIERLPLIMFCFFICLLACAGC